MKDDGLIDPKLGKRILAETRLVRYERRVERSIKRVLDKHKEHALKTLREQHTVTAAAPPDSFGLYSFDSDLDDMVVPEIGDVLGDIATGVFNFLALPPEVRQQLLGEIDVAARTTNFADKVRTIASDLAPRLMDSLSQGVAKGESIPELTNRIDDVFDTGYNIAERIARTETHGAAEATTYESAGAIANAGIEVTRTWLATSDDRVRATHAEADGQTVGMEEPFTVGDAELMYPGDPDGPPEEVISCRCSVTWDMPDTEPESIADMPDVEGESENG